MAKVTNFFVGANSGAGFQNLFGQMVDLENTYDFILLKGGPGVGKNTFMREIGRSMEQAGTTVEYLWCSGDPDSLDGIVLPELRCAIADATSPHILEPQYPAAVDRYLDLGRFYDLTAAKSAADEVKRYTREYKAAYARAYHCLQAARQVELEACSLVKGTFDAERLEKRIRGIIAREFGKRKEKRGTITRRFLGGITCKGRIWRFDSVDALCERAYLLEDRWELAGSALEQLCCAAVERGLDVLACMAPEEPSRVEHVLIPALSLAFVTVRPGMEYEKRAGRHIRVDAMVERKNLKLQRKMVSVLREEGIANLRQAKAAHDRLEAVYNPYVDFDGVHAVAALECGRLLSYLQI